jgi:SAM-dependent methyltransferase
MQHYTTKELIDSKVSVEFYESRYQGGYMEDWPKEKKAFVTEFITQLVPGNKGIALDFGCGNGVFTDVLSKALPGWEIWGCDISQSALINARRRFPNCNFETFEQIKNQQIKFDLIFSHHVLEHVSDLNEIIASFSDSLKVGGRSAHILPCGNKDSLEYKIASLVINGIDANLGNRFYYEDKGHLRRLTSTQLAEIHETFGLVKENAWFQNQYFGSLDWMSDYPHEYITKELILLDKSVNRKARLKLKRLEMKIIALRTAKLYAKQGIKHRIKTRLYEVKSSPLKFLTLPFRIIIDSKMVSNGNNFFKRLNRERANERKNHRASEMCMVFIKNTFNSDSVTARTP